MRTTPIPVTVGTFEPRRQHEGDDSYKDGGFAAPKTTTVTRMATLTGLIPVTVGTFEAYHGGVGGGYNSGGVDTIRGGGEDHSGGGGLGTQSAGPYMPSPGQNRGTFHAGFDPGRHQGYAAWASRADSLKAMERQSFSVIFRILGC